MPATSSISSRLLARLPGTTFWRIMLATLAVAVLTTVAAMVVASFVGKDMVRDIQEGNSYTVLRSSVDLIGRTSMTIAATRKQYIEDRKDSLRSLIEYTAALLDSYRKQVQQGNRPPESARRAALTHLRSMIQDFPTPVFITDKDYRLAAHSEPWVQGLPVYHFMVAHGDYTLMDLLQQARDSGQRETVFALHHGIHGEKRKAEPKLAAALYYAPWKLTIGADMFLGDVEAALADVTTVQVNEMRARINEMVLAKTGYLFVFNEQCEMIAHPTLSGDEFATMPMPGTDETMCQALKRAALAPWGENKVLYRWDRPEDRGDFDHEKIAWCTREPTTGWYVGASAYIDDMQAILPRFVWSIFLPALGSILLMGGTMAWLLRRRLKPLERLASVCQRVGAGDMSVRANQRAPGEVGDLCGHFNRMIEGLEQARSAEGERRRELTDLNRNLESIVEQRTRDLENKASKLQEANLRLTELDHMKSAFLSSVSHELRTPLTSVLGFTKLIHRDFKKTFLPLAQDRPLDRKASRILDNLHIIQNEGERLTRLINDVLDLNKIESGRIEWRDRDLRVEALVKQAVGAVQGQLKNRTGLQLDIDLPADLPLIHADQDRMLQVLINLLSNAIKFTPEGRICVAALPSRADRILITVTDTGVGIPPGDLHKIFDKFHQAAVTDTLKEKPQGTGLGLSICRQIVEHYRGRIWAESVEGQGSSFFMELPVKGASGIALAPHRSTPAAFQAGAPTILVVDDDEAINAYLAQLLEGEGYNVIRAFNGEAAVSLARERKPDLITMDIMMPVMDGKTAINVLRNDPELASAPILVVSVLQDDGNLGGDAALSKPIDEDQLIDTVNSLLNVGCSGHSLLVLKRNGESQLGAFFTLCPGRISHCNEKELWERIKAGFQGTIILPGFAARDIDLNRISAQPGVQVVIMPDSGDHD
ncbi:MAG: ATP-binding protein [Desulfovibrionaceae bacterium]